MWERAVGATFHVKQLVWNSPRFTCKVAHPAALPRQPRGARPNSERYILPYSSVLIWLAANFSAPGP